MNCLCGNFYIGRSFRKISTRVSEHLRLLKNNNINLDKVKSKSNFAEHVLTYNHSFYNQSILYTSNQDSVIDLLEQFQILYHDKFDSNRLINEQTHFQNLHIFPSILSTHSHILHLKD